MDNNFQKTSKEYLENVDGLLTIKPNTDLVLSFADCTPILLYDPVKNVIANIQFHLFLHELYSHSINPYNNEYKYISKLNKDAVLEMIKNKVV